MRLDCVLIAGGQWHDIDFARLELLKLLAEDENVRVRVFEDYSNLDAIAAADFLVTYTCNVAPSLEAQEVLRDYVKQGGRWLALHGTNSFRWRAVRSGSRRTGRRRPRKSTASGKSSACTCRPMSSRTR